MSSRRLRERRLSRAVQRAEKPPPAPHPLTKFADKARDLDLVRKSVDDAASVSAGLWLSYLFALFYVGIAAGGVTHKDLLLENPVKLPFLNVELPFVAFFVLAPILFVVSHAYTLMHFVLLASKVGSYNTELAKQIPEPDPTSANERRGESTLDHREIRRGLRRQLPSNIFVQFLAGPLDVREGGLGWLLKAIAWITLVIGPVLLLLLIQVQFLPYHLEWVTWVQRLALLADVVLLWFLWPAVLDGRSRIHWPKLWRHPVAVCVSLVPIALAFVVARYPGEWVDEHVGRARWIAPIPRRAWHEAKDWQDFARAWLRRPGWTSVHDLVFNGNVDDVTRRRKSLFSNTLVLPEFDGLEAAKIDDPKKLDGIKHSLVLRGRHLKGAVLTHADLRKADLDWAELEGANLEDAQLQGAKLDWAHLQGAVLNGAKLQGASLGGAQLQGASLSGAQLQGADFASILKASLSTPAELEGAFLAGAQLQGASLVGAQLQGASLVGASLQGASLKGAQLQGVWLGGAQLQGASLEGTQLQGANFGHSRFAGTDMSSAVVWRTNFEGASLSAVYEDALKENAISVKDFAALKVGILNAVPEGEQRDRALQRIEKLNPELQGESGFEAIQKQAYQGARVDHGAYQKALAEELEGLVCLQEESDLFILRGLIENHRISDARPFAQRLIESILSPACPVSATLTDGDKVRLKQLAEPALAGDGKQ